jgi:anti-sigma B factor antagonist
MRLTINARQTTMRMAVTGRLVLGPRLDWQRWRPLVHAAAGRVLALDMSGVSHLDAAGLGLLVTLAAEMRRRHGRLRLMCARPRVRTLLRVTGLTAAVGVVSEAAIARATRRRDVIVDSGARDLRQPAACWN